MVLSRKEQRKLNKSLKSTTRGPTKSIPIPKKTTNELFPATVEILTNPFHPLFTPQSPAELPPKATTVSDLITSARSSRAGSDATTPAVTYIPPAFNETRRDSVLDDNDDDNKRQSLRFSTRELVASIVDNTCANDADVSNFGATESYQSDSFGYRSDFENANYSQYHAFSSRPVDVERASRSSSITFTTISTARPSPTFGFALFRPTKAAVETPEEHQHSNAQKPISTKLVTTNSSSSALSESERRPGVGFRSDSTTSLIFPLDLQNNDDFQEHSTVRYNPMSGQERASGVSSSIYSSGLLEMQVVTKLPNGDVTVEDCSSVGTNSPVSCAWNTGNGYYIPSPSAVQSLADIPFERLRIGIIQGVNADGHPCTPRIPPLANATNGHTVLGSLGHLRLHGDESNGRSTLSNSSGSQTNSLGQPDYDGDYLSPEERCAETGTLFPPEPTPEVISGTLFSEPLKSYEHFPLEAPPPRTASRSYAIREGKKPADDTTAVFAPDEDSISAQHAPTYPPYHSAEELSTRVKVRPFPSSNSGRTCGNTHVMHDTPPRSDRDSGEEYDISDSIPSLDIGEESDISDSVSSLDIGRPIGAINAALLARHKKEQREKAAARQAAWEAREERFKLERELQRAVQRRELCWANRPAGVVLHPNDKVASAPTDAKTSQTSSNIYSSPVYSSLSTGYRSVSASGSSRSYLTSAAQVVTATAGSASVPEATIAAPPRAQSSEHDDDSELELFQNVKDLSSALAGMTTSVRKIEAQLYAKSRASTLARVKTSIPFTGMANPKLDSASPSVTGIAGSLAPSATTTAAKSNIVSTEDVIRRLSSSFARPRSPILIVEDTVQPAPTKSAAVDLERKSIFTKIDGPKDSYAHIMPVWLRHEMRKHDESNVLPLLEPSPTYKKQHPTFPDGTPVPSRLLTAESDDHQIPADWRHIVETVLGKLPGEPLTEADKEIIFQLVKEGYIVPPPMSIRPDVWKHEEGDDVPKGSTRATYTPGWHLRTKEEWMVCLRAFEDLHKNGGDEGERAGK